ncbi:hypothetical protein M011DRAFT_475160 [Sporormia fimetaria CBS 119925]|uniref:Uncharacterized protein n=1 Tax=Sporormia fimetaria CBS 119925 TaxID=1340428 RepID=A0A6A6VI49_9PLEO|nr:hypothetical protein M011DRAFT_475160 [Sporormia fimetaria CBS 119925]
MGSDIHRLLGPEPAPPRPNTTTSFLAANCSLPSCSELVSGKPPIAYGPPPSYSAHNPLTPPPTTALNSPPTPAYPHMATWIPHAPQKHHNIGPEDGPPSQQDQAARPARPENEFQPYHPMTPPQAQKPPPHSGKRPLVPLRPATERPAPISPAPTPRLSVEAHPQAGSSNGPGPGRANSAESMPPPSSPLRQFQDNTKDFAKRDAPRGTLAEGVYPNANMPVPARTCDPSCKTCNANASVSQVTESFKEGPIGASQSEDASKLHNAGVPGSSGRSSPIRNNTPSLKRKSPSSPSDDAASASKSRKVTPDTATLAQADPTPSFQPPQTAAEEPNHEELETQ